MTTRRVGAESAEGVRVERVTAGDSGAEVNVWLVGDDEECVVIDPPRAAAAILEAVGRRRLTAVLSTHADPGDVTAAPELLDARPRARIGVHPADAAAWTEAHRGVEPNLALQEGDIVTVGDIELTVLHTPGASPGSCCFHAADLGVLFSGPTEVAAVERLRELEPETVVLPARGEPAPLADVRAR